MYVYIYIYTYIIRYQLDSHRITIVVGAPYPNNPRAQRWATARHAVKGADHGIAHLLGSRGSILYRLGSENIHGPAINSELFQKLELGYVKCISECISKCISSLEMVKYHINICQVRF